GHEWGMALSRTRLGCPAHGYWRTAMGPTAWRWRFQKARPEGSPLSASSSKRPRHRAWCSELSSVVGCAGSTWHPREIPNNSRCQVDTSGIYPHQRMMSSPGTPRRFPAVLKFGSDWRGSGHPAKVVSVLNGGECPKGGSP